MILILRNTFLAGSLATLISGAANGQWLPKSNEPAFLNLHYAPLCNSKREQIRVRLNKSTNFLVMDNLTAGDVLYGVRFNLQSNNRPRFEGTAYCKPYIAKELGFFSSYSAKQANQRGIRTGFELCMYDFNSNGAFDDANYNAWHFKVDTAESNSDQFPYTVIEDDGEVVATCPRPTASEKAFVVGQHLWDALTDVERSQLKHRGEIDIIPAKEAGTLVQVERMDDSSAGTSSGARIGEVVAGGNYVDKAITSGNYSLTNQMGTQVLGAVIGGLLDSGPRTVIRTRYAVRALNGSIVVIDNTSHSRDFALPLGVCVSLPAIEQLEQSICEITLPEFRARHFAVSPASSTLAASASSDFKDRRLRDLKELFERGLITEKVYSEQQNRILSD